MLLGAIAFRNLGRKPARTFLTMSAMTSATALLIIALGMIVGMVWDMVAGATESYYGHAKVTAKGYLERQRIQIVLDEKNPPQMLLENPEVKNFAPRLRGFFLLSAGEDEKSQTHPAELLGVDPELESGVSRLPFSLKEGRFVSNRTEKEIVLGQGLARRLGANVGSRIAALGQASDGSIAAELFTVTGILETKDKLRDVSLAVVKLEDLQILLSLEGQVHEWVIALNKPLSAKEWEKTVSLSDSFEISTWNRFLPQLSEMLDMVWIYRMIYAVIFYFAVILITVNTMYMALLEKAREFAVMSAVGLKPAKLSSLILLETFFLSVGSAFFGGILGVIGSLYLERHPLDFRDSFTSMTWVGSTIEPVFRSALEWDQVFFAVGMTIFFGFVVSLFPAFKLFRFRAVEILREI